MPEGEWARMRAPLQGGDFPFPVKYGYAAVGTLADGHRVFCLHPHQDLFLAPRAMCAPVPDGVPSPFSHSGAYSRSSRRPLPD